MNMNRNMLRAGRTGIKTVLLAVVLCLTHLVVSAPPRPSRPIRSSATAARPRPAHHPARYRPSRTPHRVYPPKRIAPLRPVIVGGGTIVVKETASSSDSNSAGEEESPAATENPVNQTTGASPQTSSGSSASAGNTNVPSDADASMADAPTYRVAGVEDNGLTLVIEVEGEESKIRLLGLAEPQTEETARPAGAPPRLPPLSTKHFLENLLRGEDVYIVYDSLVQEQDEDGKYVAYVYRAPDGLLLNAEIIRQGFAVTDPNYDFSEKDTFLYYQNKARQAQKGFWGRSPHPAKPPRRGNLRNGSENP